MTKEIYKDKATGAINVIIAEDDKLKLTIGDKEFEITTHHYQDCCESVFAEFGAIKPYIAQLKESPATFLKITALINEGLLISFSDNPLQKVFIGCHNQQNGYYASDLEIKVSKTETYDISEAVKDDIYD